MDIRLAGVVVGLAVLAGCTGAPADVGAPAPSAGTATSTSTATATTGGPATSGGPSTSAPASASGGGVTAEPTPKRTVLSGTAIGGHALGKASAKDVDAVFAALGAPKTGDPRLCRAEDEQGRLAVVDHRWPGVTVRYSSRGDDQVAIGWTVDLSEVPDGFTLAGHVPWRPTFAALAHVGQVQNATTNGVRYARIATARLTWSGPAGAARPTAVSGGPLLTCSDH